jgi:hypothetical protein
VEKLSDEELDRLQSQFQALADHIRAGSDAMHAHSIEEVEVGDDRAGNPRSANDSHRDDFAGPSRRRRSTHRR